MICVLFYFVFKIQNLDIIHANDNKVNAIRTLVSNIVLQLIINHVQYICITLYNSIV